MVSVREPVVAGTFYPGSTSALEDALVRLFGGPVTASKADLASPVGLIVPHAGYVYSGATAAAGYRWLASLGRPAWALILGANHTGMGRPISLAQEGIWRTPLGGVPIDELAGRLVEAGLEISENAFLREHSIEVQLPFLQFLYGEGLSFVPVCVMTPALSDLMTAGEVIADEIGDEPGVVIVSSDFTHYEPHEVAQRLDHAAIEQILALDVEGFYRRLVDERLSICGGGAIALLMGMAKQLGWNQTRLLSYATSAEVSGDRSAVVGYGAIGFSGGEHG